jgi:hypothetical protein
MLPLLSSLPIPTDVCLIHKVVEDGSCEALVRAAEQAVQGGHRRGRLVGKGDGVLRQVKVDYIHLRLEGNAACRQAGRRQKTATDWWQQ